MLKQNFAILKLWQVAYFQFPNQCHIQRHCLQHQIILYYRCSSQYQMCELKLQLWDELSETEHCQYD